LQSRLKRKHMTIPLHVMKRFPLPWQQPWQCSICLEESPSTWRHLLWRKFYEPSIDLNKSPGDWVAHYNQNQNGQFVHHMHLMCMINQLEVVVAERNPHFRCNGCRAEVSYERNFAQPAAEKWIGIALTVFQLVLNLIVWGSVVTIIVIACYSVASLAGRLFSRVSVPQRSSSSF